MTRFPSKSARLHGSVASVLVVMAGLVSVLALAFATPSRPARSAPADPIPTFELSDRAYRSLLPSIGILRDPERRYGPADLLALFRAGDLRPVATRYLNMLPTPGNYWAVFAVRNATEAPGEWVVDLRRPHLLELDVWVDRGAGPAAVLSLGPDPAFAERALPSRYHGFPLALDAGEEATVVVGYRSFATGWLAPRIGGSESVVRALAREDGLNAFVNGVLVAMMAFAGVMLPVIGRRVGLAFIAYAGAGFLFIAHADGYLLALLAPLSRVSADLFGLLFALLLPLTGFGLARTLFDTRRTQPGADRLYRVLLGAVGVAVVLLPFGYEYDLYRGLSYLAVVASALAHPLIGIVALRQGQAGARPFLVGSPLIVGSLLYSALAHAVPGRFSVERTLDVGQITLIVEMGAFALTVLVRTLNLRRERDAAAHQAMTEANARLLLIEALGDSERRYERTTAQAEQAHAKLATIGHDIRQPLLSLRTTLDRLGDVPDVADRRMREAFAYMETLAREAGQRDEGAADATPDEAESFEIDVVLENAVGMFRHEADERGIALRYEPSGARVTARAIPLMRIVNNLVANAVRHSEGREVRVGTVAGVRSHRLEVLDDGVGMDAATLARVQDRGVKGEGSAGDGLGLAIVRELAERAGMEVELASTPGRGTAARLTLPAIG